ncbi:unnamed protein product [Cochlearia groenlandica]
MIGTVWSILGESNVNVNFMSVGRIAPRKQAIMAIGVDDQPSKETLKKIGEIPAVEEYELNEWREDTCHTLEWIILWTLESDY